MSLADRLSHLRAASDAAWRRAEELSARGDHVGACRELAGIVPDVTIAVGLLRLAGGLSSVLEVLRSDPP